MFEQLSYKNRNFLLLAGGLLFAIATYQLAIAETLEKKAAYDSTVTQSQLLSEAPGQIASLNRQLNNLDNMIGYIKTDSLDTQQLILEKVGSYCERHHLSLRKFPQPLLEKEQNFLIETIRFEVEGHFIPLLKLIYSFEQQNRLGKVVSVNFKREKELRSGKERLFATIFIQNIKKS